MEPRPWKGRRDAEDTCLARGPECESAYTNLLYDLGAGVGHGADHAELRLRHTAAHALGQTKVRDLGVAEAVGALDTRKGCEGCDLGKVHTLILNIGNTVGPNYPTPHPCGSKFLRKHDRGWGATAHAHTTTQRRTQNHAERTPGSRYDQGFKLNRKPNGSRGNPAARRSSRHLAPYYTLPSTIIELWETQGESHKPGGDPACSSQHNSITQPRTWPSTTG